jgi:hypothetical protein
MPNWCSNNLTIEHEDRAKVMEFVHAYKEGKVCDHYLPVPKDGSGELITDDKHPDYWYNWCANNWGTKWDIGSDNNEGHGLNPTVVDNQASMTFDSAWSPPLGLYERLVELGFKVEATYWEPGMSYCGLWQDGADHYAEYTHINMIPKRLWDEYNMGEFFTDEETVDV